MRPDRTLLVGSGFLTGLLFIATVVVAGGGPGPADSVPAGAPVPTARAVSAQVAYGARLFAAKGCDGCHGGGPVGLVGPSLGDIARTAGTRRSGISAEAYLRESIRSPQAFISPSATGNGVQMPTLPVSDVELDALIAFLLSPR